MIPIRVASGLWTNSILPQGVLQSWLRPEGALVEAGEAIACVEIEDSRHQLTAPAAGWLKRECLQNAVVEPGMVIARLALP